MPHVSLSPCLTDCLCYYDLWALHPKVALSSNDPIIYGLADCINDSHYDAPFIRVYYYYTKD
jgi:hypothetical protein